MKKLWTKVALVSAAALATACSPSNQNSSTSNSDSGDNSNEQIVIYSNSASDGRGDWLKEQAKENGFNIEVVNIPGGELADRLIAEKNNGVADMVFGLNNLEYTRLKKENILAKYEPSWKDNVDLSLGDSEGYYYPLVVQPLVLMGNKDVTMPSDWTDLAKPEYKGTYNIFKLSGGTSKIILSSILERYKDPSGDLGVSQEGWDVIKGYAQNANVVGSDVDYVGQIMEQKDGVKYQMMWGSGFLQNSQERNYDFQFMKPSIGVPFVTEQIGVLASSKKQETVKKFIDWFGADELQSAWSKKFGSIPANKKALENADPTVRDFANSVKSQQLNWDFISENVGSWVEKVELEYMQ